MESKKIIIDGCVELDDFYFGALKDEHDPHDYMAGFVTRDLPKEVDLDNGYPSNQGKVNSCVVHSIYSALGARKVRNARDIMACNVDYQEAWADQWRQIKGRDSRVSKQGAYFRDVFKWCKHFGVPTIDKEGRTDLLGSYSRIMAGLDGMKFAMSEGYQITTGHMLHMKNINKKTFYYEPSGRAIGNHAITIVKYFPEPDGTTSFKIRNSWGTKWGDGGYYYMNEKDIGDLMYCWTVDLKE